MHRTQRADTWLLLFALILAAWLPPALAQEKSKQVRTLPLVILLGDSIRMNYQEVATKALQEKATVWSPQENCKHTLYTLQNLEKWLTDRVLVGVSRDRDHLCDQSMHRNFDMALIARVE